MTTTRDTPLPSQIIGGRVLMREKGDRPVFESFETGSGDSRPAVDHLEDCGRSPSTQHKPGQFPFYLCAVNGSRGLSLLASFSTQPQRIGRPEWQCSKQRLPRPKAVVEVDS